MKLKFAATRKMKLNELILVSLRFDLLFCREKYQKRQLLNYITRRF